MRILTIFSIGLLVLGGIACNAQKNESCIETESQINSIIEQMTLEEKFNMIGGHKSFYIRPLKRLGIPSIRMADGPCGVKNYGASTSYPSPICLAASWDTIVASNVGMATAKEAKAKDVQIMLTPGMNLYRAAMCGRNFEYLGEDPYLSGQLASAYIQGMQEQGIIATAKHYVANNQEFDRNHTSSDMDERTLHELYLPAFKTCVEKAQVGIVMSSYNLINGVHASQNHYLINEILKKDWNFDGIVMSDWVSVYDGIEAAKAGLDIEMPAGKHMHPDTLALAINKGELREEIIDDKIRRILGIYYRFNLMDSISQKTNINKEALAKTALEAARGGIVLLKNENNILPIDSEKIKTIAVLGPNAAEAVTGGGGSSFVTPYQKVSILESIKKLSGDNIQIKYSEGPFPRFLDQFYENTKFQNEGLKGEYFKGVTLEGEPVAIRQDQSINYEWTKDNLPEGISKNQFSVRWTGKFRPQTSGDFYFAVSADDGFRLIVNNDTILNEWTNNSEIPRSTILKLKAGEIYDVKLEYYQTWGTAAIKFGIGPFEKNHLQESIEFAQESDMAIVCMGFDKSIEREGIDRPYSLPQKQVDFIKSIAAVNKNTVVILNAGGNADISNWIENVGGLLHAWYPGEKGSEAISEIILGKVNPSGKLPFSIEKKWEDAATYNSYYDEDKDKRVTYSEGIFLGYRHFDTHNVEPLFPFGFGMSYTTFSYDKLKVDSKHFEEDDNVFVSVKITNTGDFRGKEVIQLYVSDIESSLPRPAKELKAFAKVDLAPGETKTVKMKLNKESFSFYDPQKHNWVAESGKFEIMVGSSSKDIRKRTFITLD
ncbi:MAG: glycoside hydrolase family 3 C-terminal domain-containing protein [Labilibaculum sp.]|nr:glycoside hydrolase family 3 C-terminal domain-containing protein [Labilibaculum sp.]MBI9057330.1 glycoside hydrolase family 3 C-terminal domain-containing protein [Labilibaculum sp.]